MATFEVGQKVRDNGSGFPDHVGDKVGTVVAVPGGLYEDRGTQVQTGYYIVRIPGTQGIGASRIDWWYIASELEAVE